MEGTTWEGKGPYPEALRRQARWNRFAALSAGLAALTQVIELVAVHANVSIGPLQ